MNKLNYLLLVALPTLAVSLNATAHDPKMHMKMAEKADCSKMKTMNKNSKMPMNDPVMLAMMKKCSGKEPMDMKKMDHESSEKPKHEDSKHDHH